MDEVSLAPGWILVTGGAGFIGSHTVELLLERGARVRVLDNLSTGSDANLPLGHPSLELQIGDVLDRDALQAAMNGVSHCLHLAAQVSVEASFRAPATSANNNIIGYINVLQAAREAGVHRFVYASSAAVYGNPRKLPISEDLPCSPISPYGIEKLSNEIYAKMYMEIFGISCLGLRYFNVYGPRQSSSSSYSGVISIFMNRVRDGEIIHVYGDGEQTRDFVFVHDVAQCNLKALESRETGVCNVGRGESVSLQHLLGIISRFSPIQGKNYLPAREGDIRSSFADIERMKELLGLTNATSLHEGLSGMWNELGDSVVNSGSPVGRGNP